MLHGLIEFWFDRSGKNFFKTMPPCSQNPEPSLLTKDNHSSVVTKACAAQNAVCIRTCKPWSEQVNTELQGTQRLRTPYPLVTGRLCCCLILMLLEAWHRLLQKVHGGLDHLFWSNIVHRVSRLQPVQTAEPVLQSKSSCSLLVSSCSGNAVEEGC